MARAIEPYKDFKLPERFLRWIEILRERLRRIPCFTEGLGSPEGIIDGQRGDLFYDLTNLVYYQKTTDTGNTGWLLLAGGGGGGGPVIIPPPRRVFHSRFLQYDIRGGSLGSTSFGLRDISDWRADISEAIISGEDNRVGFITDLNRKMESFSTIPDAGQGFPVADALSFFRSRLNNDLFGIVRGPPGLGVVAFSSDNGVTWINRGTPTGAGGFLTNIVQTSNGRIWVMTRESGLSDIYYSDDSGITWMTVGSGMFAAGTARSKLEVPPDGSRVVATTGGTFFAQTTQIAVGAPVFTVLDATVVAPGFDIGIGTGNLVGRSIAWRDDSSVCFLTGSGASIIYTTDFVSFTLIPLTRNILRTGALVAIGTEAIAVYSPQHAGFFVVSAIRDIVAFHADADLDNPTQGTWEAGSGYGSATFDENGNYMQVHLGPANQVAT